MRASIGPVPPVEDLESLLGGPFAHVAAFVLGALLGSFANVCIYRMPPTEEHPRGRSVVRPGSHCQACGQPVRWYDNVPILGYLFRHTRTRTTKRNLLIFLTPYIIRDPSDFRRIFNRKMEERREFIEQISALHEREWSPDIDYSRTNGLLESINQTIEELEGEEELRRQMELEPPPAHVPSEPISTESWSSAVGDTYVEIGPGGSERPVTLTAPGQFGPSPAVTAPAPLVVQPQPTAY